jgi:hypothetical protein
MRLKPAALAGIAFALLAAPAMARASACDQVDSIRRAIEDARPGVFAGSDRWIAYSQKESESLEEVGKVVFASYISGSHRVLDFKRCFRQELWDKLQKRLPFAFISESLRRLESAPSPVVRRFALKAGELVVSGDLIRLGLQLPDDANSETNLKFGGYHRGERGLYLNPALLPPDQWFVILIHEFAHALDPVLQKAARESAALESAPVTRDFAKALVQNGFDRGFLSEVRAWTVTAHVYHQLGPESPKVAWLEQMAGAGGSSLQMVHERVFRYLEPRFTDPVEGVYAHPEVQAEFARRRSSWKKQIPSYQLPF